MLGGKIIELSSTSRSLFEAADTLVVLGFVKFDEVIEGRLTCRTGQSSEYCLIPDHAGDAGLFRLLEVTMTDAEKAYVKDVCMFFYPSNPPAEVNDTLADLAGVMLYAAIEKSKALNFVPRPPLGRPGVGWLLLQAVQMFWRSQGKTRIYEKARVAVAYQYRTPYDLARKGLPSDY